MKCRILMIGWMLIGVTAWAQHAHDEGGCDCPSCRGETKSYTLPGLEQPVEAEVEACEHDHEDHAGHDHAEEQHAAHEEEDEHTGHDHGKEMHAEVEACEHDHEDHAGHDHADHDAGKLSVDVHEVKVAKAQGGLIERRSTFPAEIKLNRDRTAAVSPRYASVVRQVFAEIGDPVSKGDVLASLENRETLAVYTVSAPLAGVIISKDLAVGETAEAGKVLYEVADLSTVWADISIFPQYQHFIGKGQAVTFIAHDGHTTEGRIRYISPIVSHETRTFTARCVLEGAGEDFTPGAFVRARMVIESEEVPVRVSREAVQQIEGESVIFLSSEDGFITQPVQTGLADDHYVAIRQGLAPGQAYVELGAFLLKAELVTSGMDPHAGHGH